MHFLFKVIFCMTVFLKEKLLNIKESSEIIGKLEEVVRNCSQYNI